MRTKTLLLGAALFAAGALSSMAQSSVYSLNVVGYVTIQVPPFPGFAMVANPLDDGAGNFLTNIMSGDDGSGNFAGLPDGTTVFPWNASSGGYANQATFFAGPGGGWSGATNQLPPGNGFWIQSGTADGSGVAFTVTLVGNVMQGSMSSKLGNGFTIAASQIPVALPVGSKGDINTAGPNDPTAPTLQIPAFDNDTIFLYTNNATASGYGDDPIYFFGAGWQSATSGTAGPTIAPGQGFWYSRGQEDLDAAGNNATSTSNGVQTWAFSFTVQ